MNNYTNNPTFQNIIQYVKLIPLGYDSSMDNIVEQAMSELDGQISIGNGDAKKLQALLITYLTNRLENDEC